MAKQRVTMQQIADEIGVSRKTVSSVINNRAEELRISKATIEKVQNHLEKRAYIPSMQAVQLRKGKNDNIGILHTGHLYEHLINAFNRFTDEFADRELGMDIIVVPPKKLLSGLEELLARGVNKVIWLQTNYYHYKSGQVEQAYRYLENINTVLYNYRIGFDVKEELELTDKGFYLVGFDRISEYATLAELMHKQGHRTVGFPKSLNHGPKLGVFEARHFEETGYRVLNFGTVVSSRPEEYEDWAKDYTKDIIRLHEEEGLTLACVGDDRMSCFVIQLLQEHGLRVPQDISVIGQDGLNISAVFTPAISTLSIPILEMTKKTMEILETLPEQKRYCFDLELIMRQSHAPAPACRREIAKV